MYDSVLDDIMATMLASASTESYTVVHKTGESGETKYDASPVVLPPLGPPGDDPWVSVSAKVHKTVDIGNMESARISIGITALCRKSKQKDTFAATEALVWKMVDREVLGVTQKGELKTADSFPLVWSNDDNPRLVMSMEYGLTINMGNYQFTKPTVGASRVFAPEEFHAEWGALSDFLSQQIQVQVKKAKNPVELGL